MLHHTCATAYATRENGSNIRVIRSTCVELQAIILLKTVSSPNDRISLNKHFHLYGITNSGLIIGVTREGHCDSGFDLIKCQVWKWEWQCSMFVLLLLNTLFSTKFPRVECSINSVLNLLCMFMLCNTPSIIGALNLPGANNFPEKSQRDRKRN